MEGDRRNSGSQKNEKKRNVIEKLIDAYNVRTLHLINERNSLDSLVEGKLLR